MKLSNIFEQVLHEADVVQRSASLNIPRGMAQYAKGLHKKRGFWAVMAIIEHEVNPMARGNSHALSLSSDDVDKWIEESDYRIHVKERLMTLIQNGGSDALKTTIQSSAYFSLKYEKGIPILGYETNAMSSSGAEIMQRPELQSEINELLENADRIEGDKKFDQYVDDIKKIFEMAKDQRKPQTNLPELTFSMAKSYAEQLHDLQFWLDNVLPAPDIEKLTWHIASRKAAYWRTKIEGIEGDLVIGQVEGDIVHTFDDGGMLVHSGKGRCAQSVEGAGHCGTPIERDGEMLRYISPERKEPVSFEWDPAKKQISQIRGSANSVPKKEWLHIIKWVITNPDFTHKLMLPTYKPDLNFKLWDLKPDEVIDLLKANPELEFGDNWRKESFGIPNPYVGSYYKFLLAKSSNPVGMSLKLLKQLGPKLTNKHLVVLLDAIPSDLDNIEDIVKGVLGFVKNDEDENLVINKLTSLSSDSEFLNKIMTARLEAGQMTNKDLFKMIGNLTGANKDGTILTIVRYIKEDEGYASPTISKAIKMANDKPAMVRGIGTKISNLSMEDIDDLLKTYPVDGLVDAFREVKQEIGGVEQSDKFIYARHMKADKEKILNMFKTSPQFKPALQYMEKEGLTNIMDLIGRMDDLENSMENAGTDEEYDYYEETLEAADYLKTLLKV